MTYNSKFKKKQASSGRVYCINVFIYSVYMCCGNMWLWPILWTHKAVLDSHPSTWSRSSAQTLSCWWSFWISDTAFFSLWLIWYRRNFLIESITTFSYRQCLFACHCRTQGLHCVWKVTNLLELRAFRCLVLFSPNDLGSIFFYWSRGRASCAQSRRSTRLQAAADCSSGKTAWQTCQPPSKWYWRWPNLCRLDLERTGSVGEPGAHRGRPCENSDEEMGLSRWRPVGGLRLRGATDDGPPPLLPSTRRGLHGWWPGHSDRAGKDMCPQVGENCVKDTKEEEDPVTYQSIRALSRISTVMFVTRETGWSLWGKSKAKISPNSPKTAALYSTFIRVEARSLHHNGFHTIFIKLLWSSCKFHQNSGALPIKFWRYYGEGQLVQ